MAPRSEGGRGGRRYLPQPPQSEAQLVSQGLQARRRENSRLSQPSRRHLQLFSQPQLGWHGAAAGAGAASPGTLRQCLTHTSSIVQTGTFLHTVVGTFSVTVYGTLTQTVYATS